MFSFRTTPVEDQLDRSLEKGDEVLAILNNLPPVQT